MDGGARIRDARRYVAEEQGEARGEQEVWDKEKPLPRQWHHRSFGCIGAIAYILPENVGGMFAEKDETVRFM